MLFSSLSRAWLFAAIALLLACSRRETPREQQAAALSAPLAASFPLQVKLRIGDPQVQLQLQLTGKKPPFDVEWHALSGGPRTIEAFRARALDASTVGDTPPIHAQFTGLPIKIIGVQTRSKNAMKLALSPRTKLSSVAELRGKKIAYSPGQAQGALVLRTLRKAGIPTSEVSLIELESDAFKDALVSQQVDVAPLSGTGLARYLNEYGPQGATAIEHGVRDNLSFFYVPSEVLEDKDKAAALRAYVALRARSLLWAYEHREQWLNAYYVKDQGLSPAGGQLVIDTIGRPEFPRDWSEAIALTQETVDLIAKQGGHPSFDASKLFDRRFESVAAEITALADGVKKPQAH